MPNFSDNPNDESDQIGRSRHESGAGRNESSAGRSERGKKRGRRRFSTHRRLFFERLANRRVLALITGAVFEDVDHSFRQEVGEPGLEGRLVYIDSNLTGTLDTGERFALTGEDGGFQFDDVEDGDHSIRLYDGSTTQAQLFPVNATIEDPTVSVSGGFDVLRSGSHTFTMKSSTIIVGDLRDGSSVEADLGAPINQIQLLADGNVMAITESGGNATAFIVEKDASLTELLTTAPWSQLTIGQDGTGVLIESTDEVNAEVWSINTADWRSGAPISPASVEVPADAQAIGSLGGKRSVFAWAGVDGLALTLWSNSTETWINETPIEIGGTTQLLSYDDASGLLALRMDNGGVRIQDVDNQFATLWTLDNVTGEVAIDGQRELLVAMPNDEALVELYDLRNGEQLAKLPVDLTTTGNISAITLSLDPESGPDLLTALGNLGNTQITLREPGAHSVTVENDTDPKPVNFGVRLTGDNTPAEVTSSLEYSINEDESIAHVSPGVLTNVNEAENDQLIALPLTPAQNGSSFLETNGGFHYTPNANFFGSDGLTIIIHDGREPTMPVPIQINIAPLPDVPEDIIFDPIELPEHAAAPFELGPLTVVDPDLNDDFQIVVSDDRFEFQDGNLVFVNGTINYEDEEVIPISVEVYDSESQGFYTEEFEMFLADENDPITAIHPDEASIDENETAATIAFLDVSDEDLQDHTYEVDDPRFEINGNELKLADSVSFDFESESVITVNITATEVGTGGSLTEPLKIHIRDIPEPVDSITLSGSSVTEFEFGAEVGTVKINGNPVPENYLVSVDDSRFEIDGSTLKLLDDVFVRKSDFDEIEIRISAQDRSQQFDPLAQNFIIDVVENPSPFHNDEFPQDVNHDGSPSANDALIIINYLNQFGPGPVGNGDPSMGYDVNADGIITALDALLIINFINSQAAQGGGAVGGEDAEGESVEKQIPDSPRSPESEDDDHVAVPSEPNLGDDLTGDRQTNASSDQTDDSQLSETQSWDSAIVESTSQDDDDDTLQLLSESDR